VGECGGIVRYGSATIDIFEEHFWVRVGMFGDVGFVFTNLRFGEFFDKFRIFFIFVGICDGFVAAGCAPSTALSIDKRYEVGIEPRWVGARGRCNGYVALTHVMIDGSES